MKRERRNHLLDLTLDDVKVGDVLLSCGRSQFSHTIRMLDGGDYSHAAICVELDAHEGPKIVESTKKGVIDNLLTPDITGQEYVDVYRFKSDTGESFKSAAWPPDPVVQRAHYYKDQKTRYAFNQLYLMSVLIFMRKAPIGKLGKANLRYCLDQMIRFFRDDPADLKKQVTCSEMVYRCFYEAEVTPKGKYGLTIRITLGPAGHLIKSLDHNIPGAYPVLDGTTESLLQEAKDLFLQIKPGFRKNPDLLINRQAVPGAKAPNPNVNADLVTPGDLQRSPNLELLGRLRR